MPGIEMSRHHRLQIQGADLHRPIRETSDGGAKPRPTASRMRCWRFRNCEASFSIDTDISRDRTRRSTFCFLRAGFWGAKPFSAAGVDLGFGRLCGADFAFAVSLPRFFRSEHQTRSSVQTLSAVIARRAAIQFRLVALCCPCLRSQSMEFGCSSIEFRARAWIGRCRATSHRADTSQPTACRL
jgi:hypothetical protein